MTRVKICCISSKGEADLAISAGASALGLVAAMPSGPGTISDEAIAAIAQHIPPGVSRFLLTARTQPEGVVAHVRATGVEVVQLVATVTPEVYRSLRAACPGVRIVQVIHVEDQRAVAEARSVADHVDALLLDSGRPSAAIPELGGTGRQHDWSISREIVRASRLPVWLAGGLTASNAADAIAAVRPFGLDLCSGVRTDGALDPVRLDAFMAAVRQAA
ncbi:MAG: phosphoribosylanthranilate isomerase [Alphaproteobacteria bacterium]|nr:phosphoribosylanthranilate isomerase [Alphaproteobacteria bacterium]